MKYRTIEEWPFEQAEAEQQKFPDDQPSYLGPIFIWAAFRTLESLQQQYEKSKDGYLILSGVQTCAMHELTMPDWLAKEFIIRFRKVGRAELGSWDEAFGKPYPKNSNLNAIRKRRSNGIKVHNLVISKITQNPLRPIDRGLFDEISQELNIGISRTEAEKLYYRLVKAGWLDAKEVKKNLTKLPRKSRK